MTSKSLLGYFSSEEHNVYLSSSKEVEGGQLGLLGGAAPIVFPAPYSGNVTSRTRQNRSQSDAPGAKDGSADR